MPSLHRSQANPLCIVPIFSICAAEGEHNFMFVKIIQSMVFCYAEQNGLSCINYMSFSLMCPEHLC